MLKQFENKDLLKYTKDKVLKSTDSESSSSSETPELQGEIQIL